MPSVSSYKEMFGSRDGSISIGGDGQPVTRYTRKFKAVLDSGGPGADVAVQTRAAQETPIRSQHPYDGFARVKEIRCTSISNDDKVWEVDVTYDSEVQSEDDNDQDNPDNPLDEPPDVEWDADQFTRPLNKDYDGKAVTNSADEQFDPLPEVDDARIVLRVTRNEAQNPVFIAMRYANAVNSDTFLGAPAGYAKAKPLRVSRKIKTLKDGARQVYYSVSYEFHFKDPDGDETWDLELLDQGFRTLEDLGGSIGEVYLNVLDSQDLPVSKPVLLDGSGAELASGAEPVYRKFKAYRRKSFAAFDMDGVI